MTKAERLKEIRRRLGPFTALQGSNEGYRLSDAELARRVAEVIEIVLELVEGAPAPPAPQHAALSPEELSASLNSFNCAQCGQPNYNHGPGHGPTVCDRFTRG
jgi:hypothetical protein